ncbi:glycoside hydrolase family 18 protein [Psychromonas sp.]|nr:glycoside hydrolase family 18 protein [Psychromonas sp.]
MPLQFKTLTKSLSVCIISIALVACDTKISTFLKDNWEEDPVVCDEDVTDVDFKQIAYLSDLDEDIIDEIDFSMLTHIIYEKIAVSSDGTLTISDDLEDELNYLIDAVVDSGEGTLILFSIGNDSDSAFVSIANSSTALDTLNEQIEDLFDDYAIDGIDIYWQFPSEDDEDDFETLIESVEDTVHDEDMLLSFAVDSGDDLDHVSDDAVDYADFIHILTVEEASNDEDDNIEDAEESVTYWTDERCVVKNKLVIAIPSQGISTGGLTKSFADIFDHNYTDVCLDKTSSRTYYYYNGIPTVTDKTEYAESDAGGVVLMSLENDIFDSAYIDDYSLLSTINSQVQGTPNTICD